MKKESGLRDEKKVGRILVSGSTVLPEKNSAGIRIVRKSKVTKQSPIVKGYPDLSDVPTDSYGNLSEAGILTNDKILRISIDKNNSFIFCKIHRF